MKLVFEAVDVDRAHVWLVMGCQLQAIHKPLDIPYESRYTALSFKPNQLCLREMIMASLSQIIAGYYHNPDGSDKIECRI